MERRDDIRAEIERKIVAARELLPGEVQPELPPEPELRGERGWYGFEHGVWEIGEEIRQLLLKAPSLRGDRELVARFLEVSHDKRAGRGRQSFVMLLGFKSCQAAAADLATEIDDDDVAGHVVGSLYRMKARGFAARVDPLCSSSHAWVRREAQRYVAWDRARSNEPLHATRGKDARA